MPNRQDYQPGHDQSQGQGYGPGYDGPQGRPHTHPHGHAYNHAHAHGQGPAEHHGGMGTHPQPYQGAMGRGGPSWLDLGNESFVKGLLVGAAATFVLTNETVQKNAIRSLVQVWGMLQGVVEEAKERFRDAEAEIQAESNDK